MSAFLEKLKNRRSRDVRISRDATAAYCEDTDPEKSQETERQAPPKFKLFRQSTQDPLPVSIDSFENLRISDQQSLNRSPSSGEQKSSSSLGSLLADPLDATRLPHDSQTSTPPKSDEKRLSRRLLTSLTRRPSQMSHRSRSSRSSSYVPEFLPIDHNADVESQWEQRATMLARAGPPSPAIPRTDSIFDEGPPRLPPVDLGDPPIPAAHRSPAGVSIRAVSEGATTSPTRQRLPSRAQSHQSYRHMEASTIPIAEDGGFEQPEQTRDDLLQSAIREHERGNLEIAAQLFKRSGSGDEGLPMGQLMYGLSLRHGWGLQRDEARAIHWLRLAASSSAAVEETALSAGMTAGGLMKGDLILAIFELGNCFRHGWGVDVDKDLARNYYETAANLGDSDAMYETAWCYETGFGMKKDKYKAAFWYRKSETNGNKIPGMQWIWKPKYDHNPFIESTAVTKPHKASKK